MGLFVLEEFDRHVAEGRVREILGDVGEVPRCEVSFAILQPERGWRLARDVIFDLRRTQRHEDVVMAMAVHQRGLVGRDFDFEDTDVGIFKCRVMMRLGRDLDFRCGLRRENNGNKQKATKQSSASHEAKF